MNWSDVALSVLRFRRNLRFNLWVWKTNLKEAYYKFYSVPEWHLENIHHDIETFIDDHMDCEENDCHGGYSDMLLEAHNTEREMNGLDPVPGYRIEVVCTRNPVLPHAGGDPRWAACYIDSTGIGEIEIDLEHCDRYAAMSPTEHEAYLKWCDDNHHSQPSDINCVYVSSMATVHIYVIPKEDLKKCARCDQVKRAYDNFGEDIYEGEICHQCFICKDCGCPCDFDRSMELLWLARDL